MPFCIQEGEDTFEEVLHNTLASIGGEHSVNHAIRGVVRVREGSCWCKLCVGVVTVRGAQKDIPHDVGLKLWLALKSLCTLLLLYHIHVLSKIHCPLTSSRYIQHVMISSFAWVGLINNCVSHNTMIWFKEIIVCTYTNVPLYLAALCWSLCFLYFWS